MLDRLLRIDIHRLVTPVRRGEINGRQVVVGDFQVATLRHGPDALVPVRGLHVALSEFLVEDGGIRHARVGDLPPVTEDIILIDRPVAVMPLGVFQQDRVADFLDGRIIR